MKEARSSGHGMDLTAMWRGVPALPAGVGIRPVSYTHLDVYKRQIITFAKEILDLIMG